MSSPTETRAARTIVGLAVNTPQTEVKKSRSRKPKSATAVPAPATEAPATTEAVDQPAEIEKSSQAVSTIELLRKRQRAVGKKLTKIASYESQAAPLNPDQLQAVSTKQSLELVQKELTEVLAILSLEEESLEVIKLERARLEAKIAEAEAQADISATKTQSDSSVVFLLHLLRLHSIYTSNSGFLPAELPVAISNATGSEVAAIRYLHSILTTGSMVDSLAVIANLQNNSEDEIIAETTYARVNSLIEVLANALVEQAATPVAVELTVKPSDSTTSLISGSPGEAPLSFLNASEILPISANDLPIASGGLPLESTDWNAPVDKVASWADEVGEEKEIGLPSEPKIDWSEDTGNDLPSLEFDSTVAELEDVSDGFTVSRGRGGRGGRGRGRGGDRRGKGRGEGRGRGRRGPSVADDMPSLPAMP